HEDRYVVIGLAHVRSPWFNDVARWATVGSLPIEFVKCVSVEELRARIGSGRPFSAALIDARLPAADRDLLSTLADAGVASMVVEAAGDQRDWTSLGAVAHLPTSLDRAVLLDALVTHGRMVGFVSDDPTATDVAASASALWRGRLVAVTGPPGSGTSTLAAALAQGLAADPRHSGDVVLADLARRAHQALLHDARDVVPGIQELVEAHRTGIPSAEQVRALSFDMPTRGYRLILGLRRPRDWISIRSRAFRAALDGLRRSARIVVADIDGDIEGEEATGSADIGDRNLLARATLDDADLVIAVGTPTTSGVHGLVGLLEDLRAHGVPGERTLVVINRGPRAPRGRAEMTRVLANLTGAADRPGPYVGPVYVTARRGVDGLHRDLGRFPSAMVDPPTQGALHLLDELGPRDLTSAPDLEPVAVVPGSLGHWHDEGDDTQEAMT
ncbi:MAG: hypothetical protein ABI239_13200, partial [Aquihabitans sp.]